MFDAPTISVITKRVGSVALPLINSEKPEKVVDFLTSATDAETVRAAFQLNYEVARVSNRQYAALMTYLHNILAPLATKVDELATAVEELAKQNSAATSLQQFPILTFTPQAALEELQKTLNDGNGGALHLMQWISEQRTASKPQPSKPWREVAQGKAYSSFNLISLPLSTHPLVVFDVLKDSRGLQSVSLTAAAQTRLSDWKALVADHLRNTFKLLQKKWPKQALPSLRLRLPQLADWKYAQWTKRILTRLA